MPKTHLKMLNHLQILLLLIFSFFVLPGAVAAQSGLINTLSFEDAQDIAIKSVRRASGIEVKTIKFDKITSYAKLTDLLKKEKYARNCLKSSRLISIQNNAQMEQTKKLPKEEADKLKEELKEEVNKLKTELNEKCFPYKRLRLTDTLDFLGITDEFRLAALRSYIVRNVEFGVQNIWGVDANGTAQYFIISGKQLEEVKTSTTVIELAKKIQKFAALPFLPYPTAEEIVRNCRFYATNKPSFVIVKKETEDRTDPANIKTKIVDEEKFIKVDTPIKDDINESNKDAFIKCLDNVDFRAKAITIEKAQNPGEKDKVSEIPKKSIRYRHGIRSIKVVNNEGDPKFYYLTSDFKNNLDSIIKYKTYKYLIEQMVLSSGIPSSDEFVAAQIVINALLNIEKDAITENKGKVEKTNDKSGKETASPLTNFQVSDMLFKIYDYGCTAAQKKLLEKISVKNNLKSFCVSPVVLAEHINNQPSLNSYFIPDQNDDVLVQVTNVSLPTTDLNELMTLETVIKTVRDIIKAKRKELKKTKTNAGGEN